MNKAQNRNTEITGLSIYCGVTLVKMSCYSGVIIGFNIMIMALKSLYYPISCLSYILNLTCGAHDQINYIFTLAVDINLILVLKSPLYVRDFIVPEYMDTTTSFVGFISSG